MKKISIIVILFLFLSITSPFTSRAFAPLVVIPPALIGASILAVAGGTLVTKVALNLSGSYGIDASNITVPIAAYNTFMVAGAEMALGYITSIPWDFREAWNSGSFSMV
ncbi:MAG: hypothetical protein JZU65_10735, partial [Chlorobium sp.]|nr:hypothetical protein [Chlorobium sp.]